MRSQKLRSKHFETTQIMFSEKKLAVYIEVIIYRTVQIGANLYKCTTRVLGARKADWWL